MNWAGIVMIFGFFAVAALFVVWLDINHPADDHNEPQSQMDEWDR